MRNLTVCYNVPDTLYVLKKKRKRFWLPASPQSLLQNLEEINMNSYHASREETACREALFRLLKLTHSKSTGRFGQQVLANGRDPTV